MSKHTPGPLGVDDAGLILDSAGIALAQVYGAEDHGRANEECYANALLFAASAALLAALRGWLAIFGREGTYASPLVNAAVNETKAAIALTEEKS